MSRPVVLERQNPGLTLSRSVLATKIALWPESGHNLAQSGHKFSYGSKCVTEIQVHFTCKVWLTTRALSITVHQYVPAKEMLFLYCVSVYEHAKELDILNNGHYQLH